MTIAFFMTMNLSTTLHYYGCKWLLYVILNLAEVYTHATNGRVPITNFDKIVMDPCISRAGYRENLY